MGIGGKAVRLVDGDIVPASSCVGDESGFVRCQWDDEFTWLSEIPALGYPGFAKVVVSKKPAAAKEAIISKKPSTRKEPISNEKKLAHSKAYHRAVTVFKQRSKMEGKDFDSEACKAFARAEAAAAVQRMADAIMA